MPAVFSKVAVALLLVAGGANAAVAPRKALTNSRSLLFTVGESTENSINDLKAANTAGDADPYPVHSWTNINAPSEFEDNAQVQTQLVNQEQQLNQQQTQKMEQLIQQQEQSQQQQSQQHGRRLEQSAIQQNIQVIADVDAIESAQPFPFHSWEGTAPGVAEPNAQVQAEASKAEASLNAQQQAELAQLIAAQKQRRLLEDQTQTAINTLKAADSEENSAPYPKHSWTNLQPHTGEVEPTSQIEQQVQISEQKLSQQQQQQLNQLVQQQEQQQQGRRLQQANVQQSIQLIDDVDAVNDAVPFPYHSWSGTAPGKGDTPAEIQAEAAKDEAALSANQQAELAQLIDSQKQRRALQQAGVQQNIQVIADVDAIESAQPFPFHSWEGTSPGVAEPNAQIQAEAAQAEASLNAQQQAELAQLIASQQQRRSLQQSGVQQNIQVIADVDAIEGAQPFPFHSWEGTAPGVAEPNTQIQAEATQAENSLNAQQQQELAYLIANQKQ